MPIQQYNGPFAASVPRPQRTQTRGDQLMDLNELITQCNSLIYQARSQVTWPRCGTAVNGRDLECPSLFLAWFCNRVPRLLADIGQVGVAALRRFERIDFYLPKTQFETVVPPNEPGARGLRVPTKEGLKKYARLLRKLKAELVAIKDREFLGLDRTAKITRRKKSSIRDRDQRRIRPLSVRDAAIYDLIGEKGFKEHSNTPLWITYRRRAAAIVPGITLSAFRHRANRIRTHYDFPTSESLKEK